MSRPNNKGWKEMRKLKVIGLAALAVLAVSAVSASAANAAEGTAVVSEGSTGFTATQTGTGHTFTLPGNKVLSCATATFSGTVTNGSKSVTATPNYGSCTVKVEATTLKATVTPTGCTYKFYDLTTTAANTYAAKTDLECTGTGVHIIVRNEADTANLCEYLVDPQTGLTGVHFTDNANNTLNIKATEVAVSVTKIFGTVGNCGGGTTVSKYNGDTVATPASGNVDIDD